MLALHGTIAISATRSNARLVSARLPGPSATTKSDSFASSGRSLKIVSGSFKQMAFTPAAASRIHCDDDCWESQSASVTLWPCLLSQAARWYGKRRFADAPF